MVPTPVVTAISVAMPLAQNPSILPAASASAAVSPKLTVAPVAPGTGAISMSIARRVEPGRGQQAAQPHLDPGRRADPPAPAAPQVAAGDAEIGAHHQEPVHPLCQCAEQSDAAPFGEGGERAMRGAADEIDLAVAQCRVGAIDREDQLGRDRDPLALEKPELGCGQGGEIRIRDQVRYREPHRCHFDVAVSCTEAVLPQRRLTLCRPASPSYSPHQPAAMS